MEQEYLPKPIDKAYLKSSFKDFDSEVLSKRYLKSDDLKTVAFTGSYDDLTDKPDIPNLSASTTLPKAPGAAAAGTETDFARGDHVHPLQTSVTGNAGTATKLQTARMINGIAFDGSDDITVTVGTTLTATLAAGETTLTFTDSAITDNSMVDIYTSAFGINPSAIEQSGNTLTLTFDAQAEAVGVKVKVI